jgi:hypothetical protein
VSYSLADSLRVVLPHLSRALATPKVQADLRELAAMLAPVPWGGFECRLGANETQIDLHQGIAADKGHAATLLKHIAAMGEKGGGALPPAWVHIRDFCVQWSDPSTPLAANISKLGLEFDISAPTFQTQAPSVFVQLKRDMPPIEGYVVARAVLQTLWGGALSPALQAKLGNCFTACAGEAEVSHMGVMLSRELEAVRVNVRRLKLSQLRTYLQDVGWSYPTGKLETLFAELIRYVDRIILCLDVGTSIHPKIGLECAFDRQPAQEPRYAVFLQQLVERGLCAPEKVDPLLAWSGLTSPLTSAEPWPGYLLATSLLQVPDQFSAFERYLSHIKIDYQPCRPLEAKGYLGFNHRWLQPTATVESDGAEAQTAELRTSALDLQRGDDLDGAIEAAVAFLLRARNQGGWWRDFDDLMGGSDEWVTAYAGTALATIPDRQAKDAAQSAWNLLIRHRHPSEGWAFNIFLPTDTDATAWSLRLANALGMGHTPRAQDARLFLDQHTHSDGGIASWLAEDCPYLARFLRPGSLAGLCVVHACVTAAAAADEFSVDARNYLRNTQRLDGGWRGYWWEDDEYTTALAAQALAQYRLPGDDQRVQRAVRWAAKRIGSSGAVLSVAHGGHSAFATALCVQTLVLADNHEGVREPLTRAASWLVEHQKSDGSWNASARMRVHTYAIESRDYSEETSACMDERRIFTTATVVAALQMARAYFEAVGEL